MFQACQQSAGKTGFNVRHQIDEKYKEREREVSFQSWLYLESMRKQIGSLLVMKGKQVVLSFEAVN